MAANSILAKLAVQITADNAKFGAALNQSRKDLSNFSNSVKTLGKSLIAGFGLAQIGQDVIRVTSEFQKFEAVLTNTLGSNSRAQKALQDIKDFAISTPFEVSEITAAYVRWANQGLTPTIDKMRKLGDVASSLGAGFEQTAEAFKDLAVGQTKRLEEIGISAEAIRGTNQLRLAFKGVTLEIEKNAAGVEQALNVYSQLNGVLGTSDAVSKTLGGRISNLKDSYDGLMMSIGSGTSGPLVWAVENFTKLNNQLSHFRNEFEIDKAVIGLKKFRDLSKETLDYIINFESAAKSGKKLSELFAPLNNQSNIDFLKNLTKNQEVFNKVLTDEGATVEQVSALWKRYVERRLEAAQADKDAEKQSRLKEVLDAKASAINAYNERLKETKKHLKEVKEHEDRISAATSILAIAEHFNKVKDEVSKASAEIGKFLEVLNPVSTKLPAKIEIPPALRAFIDSLKGVGEEVKEVFVDISGLIASGLTDIGDAIGHAVGSGNFKDLGKGLLTAFASFAQQLGALMIATGVAKQILISGSPAAMIAAGTALFVIGSATRAALSKQKNIASGPGLSGGGSSSGSSGSYVSSAAQNQPVQVVVSGMLRGQDIWLSGQNYESGRRGRTPNNSVGG